MSGWRSSRLIAGLVMCLFLAVQLAIPISRFNSDSAMRFGWQMFSASYQPTNFRVETPEGQIEVELDEFMVDPRVDVDMVRWLPPHLCATIPEAIQVTWDGGSHQC